MKNSLAMTMSRTIAVVISILFISTMSLAQSGPQLNRDPASVKFVTSDIGNFWRAYDLAANVASKMNQPQKAQKAHN
jgi:hypothetical protein